MLRKALSIITVILFSITIISCIMIRGLNLYTVFAVVQVKNNNEWYRFTVSVDEADYQNKVATLPGATPCLHRLCWERHGMWLNNNKKMHLNRKDSYKKVLLYGDAIPEKFTKFLASNW